MALLCLDIAQPERLGDSHFLTYIIVIKQRSNNVGGRGCNTFGNDEKFIKCCGKPEGKDYLENTAVDVTLKRVFKKDCMRS